MVISIRGDMILYQRYMHQMSHRLPSKLPVRQQGCVNEAEGVKYFSIVARWVDGADWVNRRMTRGMSETEDKG